MSTRDANEELAELVDLLAARYARRCWWADEDDVRQEAWAMALRIRSKFDASKAPGGIKAYARRGIGFAVTRHVMTAYVPVSASDHGRYNLIGLRYAPVDEADGPDERTAEGALEVERWKARVTVRLRAVVGDAAEEVLHAIEETKPLRKRSSSELALLVAIAADEELLQLWKEREE